MIDLLIDLRNDISKEEIPENANPERKKKSILLKKSSTLINNKKMKELKY